METYWNKIKPFTIPNTNYKLCGFSIGAFQTSFFLPELKIMLDCGVPNNFLPENIFITHGHFDHSYYLAMNIVELANKKNQISKIPNIFVPNEILQHTKDYIYNSYKFSKNNPKHTMLSKINLIPVNENENIKIEIKKRPWSIEIIKCDHTVPCMGYGFSEIRTKIKDEYKEFTGKELSLLKKQNVVFTYEKEIPIFCYLGDTSEIIIQDNKILKYPLILIECTFLYPEHLKKANDKKHIHWSQIEEYIKKNEKNYFILYHFSKRYKNEEIADFFKDKMLPNIFLWI